MMTLAKFEVNDERQNQPAQMDTMSRRIAELASQLPPYNINDERRVNEEVKKNRRDHGLPSDSDGVDLWDNGYFEPK